MTVKVVLKSGVVKTFSDTRAGGSYSNSVRYEGAFVIVRDVWGNETAFPAQDVAEVKSESVRGW